MLLRGTKGQHVSLISSQRRRALYKGKCSVPQSFFLIKRCLYSHLVVRKKIPILSLIKKMAMVQRWPRADRRSGGLDDARVKAHTHLQQVSTTLNLGEPEKHHQPSSRPNSAISKKMPVRKFTLQKASKCMGSLPGSSGYEERSHPGGAPVPLSHQHHFCSSVLLPQDTVAELSAPL